MKTTTLLLGLALSVGTVITGRAESHVVGNGGDVITCATGNPFTIELLDFFEAAQVGTVVPINGNDPVQMARELLARQNLTPRIRAYILDQEITKFIDKTQFVSGLVLNDIPDSQHLGIPRDCQIEQIAIQGELVGQQYSGKYYLVNQDLWDKLNSFQKAGLILHEVLYNEAVILGAKNSLAVRRWLGSLARNQIEADLAQWSKKFSGTNSSWGEHGLVYGGTSVRCDAGLSFDNYFFGQALPTLETLRLNAAHGNKPEYFFDSVSRCFGETVSGWRIAEDLAKPQEVQVKLSKFRPQDGTSGPARTLIEFRNSDATTWTPNARWAFDADKESTLQVGFDVADSKVFILSLEMVDGTSSGSPNTIKSYARTNDNGYRIVSATELLIYIDNTEFKCSAESVLVFNDSKDEPIAPNEHPIAVSGCRTSRPLEVLWKSNEDQVTRPQWQSFNGQLNLFKPRTALLDRWLSKPIESYDLPSLVPLAFTPDDPTNIGLPVKILFNGRQKLPIERISFGLSPLYLDSGPQILRLVPYQGTVPARTILRGRSVLNQDFEIQTAEATLFFFDQAFENIKVEKRNLENLLERSTHLGWISMASGTNVPICDKRNVRYRPTTTNFADDGKARKLQSVFKKDWSGEIHCFIL